MSERRRCSCGFVSHREQDCAGWRLYLCIEISEMSWSLARPFWKTFTGSSVDDNPDRDGAIHMELLTMSGHEAASLSLICCVHSDHSFTYVGSFHVDEPAGSCAYKPGSLPNSQYASRPPSNALHAKGTESRSACRC